MRSSHFTNRSSWPVQQQITQSNSTVRSGHPSDSGQLPANASYSRPSRYPIRPSDHGQHAITAYSPQMPSGTAPPQSLPPPYGAPFAPASASSHSSVPSYPLAPSYPSGHSYSSHGSSKQQLYPGARSASSTDFSRRPVPPPPVSDVINTEKTTPNPFQRGRPLPARPGPYPSQRPVPPDVSGVANGVQNLSTSGSNPPGMGQHQSVGPPGLISLSIGDVAKLPRPDMSGPSVTIRVASADPPPVAPHFDVPPTLAVSAPVPVDPAACPSDIFVPASPRCVRLTNTAFPNTKALGFKYSLPLGAVVQPLAPLGPNEDPVPVVNFGSSGIVRCRNCRSYINFASIFLDGGRRWKCSLCSSSNDCPSDYFSPLDQNGKRRDAAERPELHRGSVEFVAPAEYMVRPPMPPVYMFLLETTPAAVNSGVLAAALAGIRNSIDSMPNEGRTRIAIMTFDSAIQFYSLRPGEDVDPSVYVLSDIEDVFLPTPDEILVQLTDCRPCFEKTLDLIANTYTPSDDMVLRPSCLGAAMQGAVKAMELIGGKLIVVAASRPTAGPGKLRERGDNSILGTERERAILRPETGFYREMAVTMSKCQIGCDLFVCPPPPAHYMDIAALAQAAKFTGGELFHCANYESAKDAPRLQLAINRVLARETGLEAVMRIRATKSIRCTKFSGRFFVRSMDLLGMSNVDSDKAYAVQFNFDEVNINEGPFCLQVALLYTTTSGERRIRVHTLAVPLVNNLHDLFTRVDVPSTANILLRTAAEAMKDRNLDDLRKGMNEKLTTALIKYKEVCQSQYASLGGSGQLLMTEAMKLLPLFMHGIGRSAILSRDTAGAFLYKFDDKSALVHDIDVMTVAEASAYAYPNMLPVYPWPTQGDRPVKHPNGLPASFQSLRPDLGVLIDDGRSITLWLGEGIVHQFLSELMGGVVNGQIDARFLGLELMRRGANAKGMVAQVFSAVRIMIGSRRPHIPVQIVPQGDRKMQARIEAMMMEERTASILNYRDFLLDIQRKVAQNSVR